MSYYELLGIDKTASPEQIKKAYRRCVQVWHTEKGIFYAHPNITEINYPEIQKAYNVLSDPYKRALYDAGKEIPETDFKALEFLDFFDRSGMSTKRAKR